jgi:NAD(P)-dependent dehydrogenase (short-subunit alcohol dehydrogenase family)
MGDRPLEGRVALVTGGNSGIGLGMARGLVDAGAAVAIWGTNPEKNARASEALRAAGGNVVSREVDIGDETQVVAGMAALVEELGRLDACFANAAKSSGQDQPRFVDSTLEQWQAMLRVNLDGTYLTLREAAKVLVAQGDGGSLVAMTSIAARFGSPREHAFATTKGGIIALVQTLAVELGRHAIRVNALMPAWTESEATEEWQRNPAVTERILPRIPLRRWGRADEWAAIAVYLAGDGSTFHTGDVIRIDGGYSLF